MLDLRLKYCFYLWCLRFQRVWFYYKTFTIGFYNYFKSIMIYSASF